MEFNWVMGCGLGWSVGLKFLLCDWLGLGWVSRLVGWVGLHGWVEEIRSTDNSDSAAQIF